MYIRVSSGISIRNFYIEAYTHEPSILYIVPITFVEKMHKVCLESSRESFIIQY